MNAFSSIARNTSTRVKQGGSAGTTRCAGIAARPACGPWRVLSGPGAQRRAGTPCRLAGMPGNARGCLACYRPGQLNGPCPSLLSKHNTRLQCHGTMSTPDC
ncbi:hypothetical protein L493_3088 [Bordetella bronchiseptica 99-R-0433]|nr:hypothetical protein L493_3088 [Bordetella bronchiseptica 99-R-0433]